MNDFERSIHSDTENPWDVLKSRPLTESDEPDESFATAHERLSKKPIDIFVRQVFELNPALRDATSDLLKSYDAQDKKLPFVHITPDNIEYEDGEVVSTGNVEHITNNGFLPGDSNVGGFLAAGRHYDDVGEPKSFKTPEAFLKSYVTLLKHYLHHASRSNHRNSEAFSDKKIKNIRPALVLVRGDLKVDHGTDYEDHFVLRDGSSRDDIVGVMSVDEKINLNDPDSIAHNYANLINLLTTQP